MQLLIDYSSMLYRAYHSNPDTIPMNGVHGFLNMLARILGDRRPDGLGICCDDDWRPDFRVQAIPEYKAHRVSDQPDPVTPQEQVGREVLQAIGLAVAGYPGYEAEDLIATLAARTSDRVEILSGDRDLFALVEDPRVRVLYPARGTSTLIEMDEAEVTRRYGIPGRRYGDFALLRGDPSDGLPGVKGIGEKTAARLIAEHGSLAALRACATLGDKLRQKLQAAADYLDAAQRVVLPVAEVPIGPMSLALPTAPADPATLEELGQRYRLTGAVGRVLSALSLAPAGARS